MGDLAASVALDTTTTITTIMGTTIMGSVKQKQSQHLTTALATAVVAMESGKLRYLLYFTE